jgi:hypothetical protein
VIDVGRRHRLALTLRNRGQQAQTVHVGGLHHNPHTFVLGPHDSQMVALDPFGRNHGW